MYNLSIFIPIIVVVLVICRRCTKDTIKNHPLQTYATMNYQLLYTVDYPTAEIISFAVLMHSLLHFPYHEHLPHDHNLEASDPRSSGHL